MLKEYFQRPLDIITNSLTHIMERTKDIAPDAITALIIVIVGYLVSSLIGYLIRKTLYLFKLDKKFRKADLRDSLGKVTIARFLGLIVKWYVLIIFLKGAVGVLPKSPFVNSLTNFIGFLPALVTAAFVIVVGLLITDFVLFRTLKTKKPSSILIGKFVKAVIVVLVSLTFIDQIGINASILERFFLLTFGAVLLGIALAFGIGFGLGLKDQAGRILRDIRKSLK